MAYTWTNSVAKDSPVNNLLIAEERSKLDSLHTSLCTSFNATVHGANYSTNKTDKASNNSGYKGSYNSPVCSTDRTAYYASDNPSYNGSYKSSYNSGYMSGDLTATPDY